MNNHQSTALRSDSRPACLCTPTLTPAKVSPSVPTCSCLSCPRPGRLPLAPPTGVTHTCICSSAGKRAERFGLGGGLSSPGRLPSSIYLGKTPKTFLSSQSVPAHYQAASWLPAHFCALRHHIWEAFFRSLALPASSYARRSDDY